MPVSNMESFTVEVTASAAPAGEGPLFEYIRGSLRIFDAGGNTTEMSGNLFDMITALSHELRNRLVASALSQGLGDDSVPHVGAGPMDDHLSGAPPR
jgi:hypothetical protein